VKSSKWFCNRLLRQHSFPAREEKGRNIPRILAGNWFYSVFVLCLESRLSHFGLDEGERKRFFLAVSWRVACKDFSPAIFIFLGVLPPWVFPTLKTGCEHRSVHPPNSTTLRKQDSTHGADF
jgi:hypothetical protein